MTINQQLNQLSQSQLCNLKKPNQRIKQMIKVEADIVDILKKSLTLQYESFETKYKAFKQSLHSINIQSDKDYENFNQFFKNNEITRKQTRFITQLSPQSISQQNESNSYGNSMNQDSYESVNEISLPKRVKKMKNRSQFQESNRKSNANIQNGMANKPMKLIVEEDINQSDNQDKEKRKFKISFMLSAKGSNRYQQTRQQIKHTIQKKGRIVNHFNRIGELLLLPYSTLQMLIDYNESDDYPLVKQTNNEVNDEQNSD